MTKGLAAIAVFGVMACGATRGAATPETAAESVSTTVLPRTPYLLPSTGHGLMQSPINIRSLETADGIHQIVPHYDPMGAVKVENKGHVVQLDWAPGSELTFDGKVYDFHQLHFHTPSEHLLDGVTYPLEVHMVHTLHDGPTDPPEYLVIGLWFKEGRPSPLLADVLATVPDDLGDAPVDIAHRPDAAALVGSADAPHACFSYRGSLTTPPYSETVQWVLSKTIFEGSPAQIERMNLLEGNNARHVQAQGERTIER